MEVALKFDWPNHEHFYQRIILTRDHYGDVEIIFCRICDQAASQSGIPGNRHFEHPKGCRCYWCAYCRCPKLLERENDPKWVWLFESWRTPQQFCHEI